MTQKELCYMEDAVGHENNIIKICTETINSLEDENLITFMEQEKEKHVNMKNKLMEMLEVKSNE